MIGSSDGSNWMMFVAMIEVVLAVVGAAAVEVPVQTVQVTMRAATVSEREAVKHKLTKF